MSENGSTPRLLAAGEGEVGPPAGVRDRFMIDGADVEATLPLVERHDLVW